MKERKTALNCTRRVVLKMCNLFKKGLGKAIPIFVMAALAGCATPGVVPPGAFILRSHSTILGGVEYLPAVKVCQAYGLDWSWDSVARRCVLERDGKRFVFLVGSDLVKVGDRLERMEAVAEFQDGAVMLPASFVEGKLASMAGLTIPTRRPKRPAKRKIPRRKVSEKEVDREKIIPGRYRIRKIVLDPGHGGKDPGAVGKKGLLEKDVNLDIAKRLKYLLESNGIKVTMTRYGDEFISLWKRPHIANKEEADFFISIHSNACRWRGVRGFEVYYLPENTTSDSARAVAAAENASLKFEESSFHKPTTALKATLWDIEYDEIRAESIDLADYVCEAAGRELGVENRGVKGGLFYVLKGAEMPSILVEVGFISNPAEESRLKLNSYRQMIAEAMAQGILDYKRKYERTDGFTR